MKWVLWLALVGLVSMAEGRSINYEYEDKQGLDSEQKGYAGEVTGKYETMDHNGNIVEVRYIADHMGFRLMDEFEVTDKNINSPNAELEIEPTEHKTQTEEQTTNEPINRSVKLAEQEMESPKQTTLEGADNEGEEAAQENTETGKQSEGEEAGEEAEAGEAEGEEAEAGEAEGGEAEGEEAEAEEAEGEEAEGEEAEGEEAEGEEAESEESEEGEEAEGEEAEGEEAEGEEAEGEEAEGEEAEGEEAEGEEAEGEEAEGEEAEGEEAEGEEAEAEEAGGEETGVEEAEAEETEEASMNMGEDTEPNESEMESEAETSPTEEQEEELAIDGESKNLEEELENNDIAISKRKGEDLENNEYYQLRQILQVPTAAFESISILPQNRLGFEQETVGRSSKAKSLLSVQNIDNTLVTDARYKQLTMILQVPTSDYIRMPQPLQLIDVTNRKSDEQEIVYYDDQSADISNIRISEVNQEMNILPKRMISITSKHLNNINPGTVMIEKTSVSEYQSNPEVVLVHMKEPGRLTIESHPVKKEIAVEPFSRRSSMKIESETIDEKDFKISEEPKLFVQEIFQSEGSVQSQLLESQPKIETITSKQLNNFNPGTVMIQRTSFSESQSNPEVVLVRMEEPGKLTIEAQPVKKEIEVESFSKRTSLEIQPFQQFLKSQNRIELKEAEPLVILPNFPKPSKVNIGLLPITIEKSLASDMPKFTDDQEMVIETEVIEDIPLPMHLIQPAVSKTHVLKKISDRNVPKQFLRFAPKPIPVLLQQTPSFIQLFEEAPTAIEMISQQPTPKEVRIIEVRSAPKPMTILQVNPNSQLQISENEQVIYDNKNTKITREVIVEDVTSSKIQSFKVLDFVRF